MAPQLASGGERRDATGLGRERKKPTWGDRRVDATGYERRLNWGAGATDRGVRARERWKEVGGLGSQWVKNVGERRRNRYFGHSLRKILSFQKKG